MSQVDNLYQNFINDFSETMCLLTEGSSYSNILFVCIGTDRITGDAFGPLVGYKLKKLFANADRINVIGDLENPVRANNIECTLKWINENFTNPFIIAVDSALSVPSRVGSISVGEGPLSLRYRVK